MKSFMRFLTFLQSGKKSKRNPEKIRKKCKKCNPEKIENPEKMQKMQSGKNRKGSYTKPRLVKLQTAGVNENKKNSNNKICMQQKTLRMWQLSRQNKSRPKLSQIFF